MTRSCVRYREIGSLHSNIVNSSAPSRSDVDLDDSVTSIHSGAARRVRGGSSLIAAVREGAGAADAANASKTREVTIMRRAIISQRHGRAVGVVTGECG